MHSGAAELRITAGAVIGAGARIGARSRIGALCVIGPHANIGEDCELHARAVIQHGCVLGNRVILHPGVVIGADGFGLAWQGDSWLKVPQTGRAILEDDVEIGANTCIDRGALDDTVIEAGAKLDNLIQIAHNCRIGRHTAIAACVGIAGSTKIGRRCTIGGAGMISGHLELADDVHISGGTLVGKSLPRAGQYTSVFPLEGHQEWLHNAAQIKRLAKLAARVAELEKKLETMGKTS